MALDNTKIALILSLEAACYKHASIAKLVGCSLSDVKTIIQKYRSEKR